MSHEPKNYIKSLLEPADRSCPQNSCSNLVSWLAGIDSRRVGASFGRLLSVSWPAFGRPWPALGPSWALLGRLLGTSWALLAGLEDFLGSFWFPGTPQASILEGSGTCWARFWKAPGECFGMPFSAPRTSLRNALINAVTTLFHLPALLILPSGAAVCAQHMESAAPLSVPRRVKTKAHALYTCINYLL